jgi:endonuclease/exonuclease/phosphatase family metal-dependent hydrolase
MNPARHSTSQAFRIILFFSLLFLIALQLLTDFVEALYAFGLFGTGIPPEIVAVLCLLSPLLLVVLPGGLSRRSTLALGLLLLACRAIEALLATRGQMLVSGLGLAAWMLFLPGLLKHAGPAFQTRAPVAGLSIGLALAILFRAAGSGLDLSVDGSWRWLGIALAALCAVLLPGSLHKEELPAPERPAGAGKTAAFSLGLVAGLVVLFYGFTNPGILARWVGGSYPGTFGGVLLALFLFSLLLVSPGGLKAASRPAVLLAWNGLFVAALVFTILPYQISFPSDLASYPLYEPQVGALQRIPFYLMILLFPVVLLDFGLFASELARSQPSWRKLGIGFSLAGLFLLLMILAHVFTTVYDYIPVIGPFFRDRFWLVHLVAGLGLALPTLLVGRPSIRATPALESQPRLWAAPLAIGLISLLSLLAVWQVSAQPIAAPSQAGSLRVFTYNIQQAYSAADQRNLDGQIALIRSKDPDLLGLQESDSARIANGNADLIRYYADRLNMYAYYGPTPISGTFGIALLSKYPLENPRTFYMYSQGEQTAAIVAQITANGKAYQIYVTHLGNGGPIFQQEAILKDLAGKSNLIVMGDFNFRTYEPQYALTTQSLQDAWLARWPGEMEASGLQMPDRIDYIFTSPGMEVLEAGYLTDPQSDHPALYAELR